MRQCSVIFKLVLTLCTFTTPLLFAQIYSSADKSPKKTVHQLFLEDEKDRSGPQTPGLNERDEFRRSQLRLLLVKGAVQTAQDFHDAAYIFQHSENTDDCLLAHILAVEAIVKGDAKSKWISAATLDRYLQATGKGQVFGTQYADKVYIYRKLHQGDPSALTKPEANEQGMTQEPFSEHLIPDALRKDFCVPSREQQKINLLEFEVGKYPTGIIPPGCTR
jgi:hypothetical protein